MSTLARAKQGFINNHRRPLLVIFAIIFFSLWFFVDNPYPVSDEISNLVESIGIIVMLVGVLGRMLTALTICGNKNRGVLGTEMYSIVRHPMYFSSFVMFVGAGIVIGRIDLMVYMISVFIICFLPMMKNEEKYLEQLFGDEYAAYKKDVPFFVPNLLRWHARSEITVDYRLFVKTALDTFSTLLLIPGIEIAEVLVKHIKYL